MLVNPEIIENSPRFYRIGDKTYPSVTTVLSFFPSEELKEWIRAVGKEEAQRIASERAVIGRMIHYLILSKYSSNLKPPSIRLPWKDDSWEDEVEHRSRLALAMYEELGLRINPQYVEHSFVTERYGYGGTPDLIADSTLYEIKTSKQMYREHEIQVGAYWLMLRQNRVKVNDCKLIYLHPFEFTNPELKARVFRLSEPELRWFAAEFLNLLKIYKREVGR